MTNPTTAVESCDTGTRSRIGTWAIRVIAVAIGLVLWFWTQSLIGQRPAPTSGIGDGIHNLTAPLNAYLQSHASAANALLIISSGVIDLLAIYLLGSSIFGKSLRPFIGLLIVFLMRQFCQAFCPLMPPPGVIWRNPGFPSLLVTYGVANDFFFSGHTSIAVVGAVTLLQTGRKWLGVLGIAIAVFEACTVLVLRAHWTMDVFTGILAALLATIAAARIAPAIDRALASRWKALVGR